MSANQGTVERQTIPSGWRWAKLGEILESLETGTRPKGGAIGIIKGIPSISAEQMTSHGTLDFSVLRYVPEEFYNLMTRGHIQEDDILLVKDGATTGKVCIVRSHFSFKKAVINEHVFLCRPKQDLVFPLYLFFWLWGPFGQQSIRACYQGAAIGGINQSIANLVVVPLPPVPEQKRIAAILDEQMAAVERARAAAEVQLEAAKALPSAYLRQVFPTERRELPPGWRWAKLGNFARLLPSKSIMSDGDVEVQTVTTACLTESGFSYAGIKTNRMAAKDVPACVLNPDEILIARSNTAELVGRVALFKGAANQVVASDLTIRIKTSDDVDPSFLTNYLSSLFISGYWRSKAGGASGSMKKITRPQIEHLQIPMCEKAEQKRFVAILDEQMSSAERLRNDLEKQLDEINALPAALLRRTFRGEL